jgi:hypothetical protein
LSCIRVESANIAALGFHLVDERPRLFSVAPDQANGKSAFGKPPGNSRADCIACADQESHAILLTHLQPQYIVLIKNLVGNIRTQGCKWQLVR